MRMRERVSESINKDIKPTLLNDVVLYSSSCLAHVHREVRGQPVSSTSRQMFDVFWHRIGHSHCATVYKCYFFPILYYSAFPQSTLQIQCVVCSYWPPCLHLWPQELWVFGLMGGREQRAPSTLRLKLLLLPYGRRYRRCLYLWPMMQGLILPERLPSLCKTTAQYEVLS